MIVDPAELELDPASAAALAEERSLARRNLELLREYAARAPAGKAKKLSLRFCVSPVAILGEGKVEAVEVVRNTLRRRRGGPAARGADRGAGDDPLRDRAAQCRLSGRSRFPGCPSTRERGVIPNTEGRVLGEDGEPRPGLYCAGWIKRGPSGVIGTNKKDAAETAAHVLADAEAGLLRAGEGELEALLVERGLAFVEYAGWEAIDAHERGLGAAARPPARQARELGRAARPRRPPLKRARR